MRALGSIGVATLFMCTSAAWAVDGYRDLQFGMDQQQAAQYLEAECSSVDIQSNTIQASKCFRVAGQEPEVNAIFDGEEKLVAIELDFANPFSQSVDEGLGRRIADGLNQAYQLDDHTSVDGIQFLVFEGGQVIFRFGLTINHFLGFAQPVTSIVYAAPETGESLMERWGLGSADPSEF